MATLLREDTLLDQNPVARAARRYGIPDAAVIPLFRDLIAEQKSNGNKPGPIVTDDNVLTLVVMAERYGLDPVTREFFAFVSKTGRLVTYISVDGWSRLINANPLLDGLEFEYSETVIPKGELKGLDIPIHEWIECRIWRRDRSRPIVIREYAEENYKPPASGVYDGKPWVANGPWQGKPKRMLRHKALMQAGRIAFGITGLADLEEARETVEAIDVESAPAASQAANVSLMPRALEHNPSQTLDQFMTGARAAAEAVHSVAGDARDAAPAQKASPMSADAGDPFDADPPKTREPRDPPAADFTARNAPRDKPARKTAPRATAKVAAPDEGEKTQQTVSSPETRQAGIFDSPSSGEQSRPAASATSAAPSSSEPSADAELPPNEPVSERMREVLVGRMKIAGKNEVDLKAKFGIGLDGLTKRNYADVDAWIKA
jgi:hypothetical protein